MSNIEQILKNYPILQAEIKAYKLQLEYMGIIGRGNCIKPSTPTNAFNSNVENEVINREEMLKAKELELSIIDNALSVLDEYEIKLIELRYFKKLPRKTVAAMLYVSERYVWSRTKQAVNKIKPLMVTV